MKPLDDFYNRLKTNEKGRFCLPSPKKKGKKNLGIRIKKRKRGWNGSRIAANPPFLLVFSKYSCFYLIAGRPLLLVGPWGILRLNKFTFLNLVLSY